jgi:hypothetical protein
MSSDKERADAQRRTLNQLEGLHRAGEVLERIATCPDHRDNGNDECDECKRRMKEAAAPSSLAADEIANAIKPAEEEVETPCTVREDKQHCRCWYDGSPCCACGSGTKTPPRMAYDQHADGWTASPLPRCREYPAPAPAAPWQPSNDPVQIVRARRDALAGLDALMGTAYANGERHAIQLCEIIETVRATCTVNLKQPDYPSSHEALRAIQLIVGLPTPPEEPIK